MYEMEIAAFRKALEKPDIEDVDRERITKHLQRLEAHDKLIAEGYDENEIKSYRTASEHDVGRASGEFKGRRYIQLLKARAVAHLDGELVADVVKHMYGSKAAPLILKAADPVVTADVPTAPGIQDFVEILAAVSMYDQLGFTHIRQHVPIAVETDEPTAHFIGEGQKATASKWAAETITLPPRKVVTLVPQTIEAVRDNSVNSDRIVQARMVRAISTHVDAIMFGVEGESGTAVPAGLLNTATELTSSGETYADLTADIKGILENVPPELAGEVTLLVNPRLAFAIGTVRTELGVPVFPGMSIKGGMLEGLPAKVSNAIPADRLIGLVEREIYSIGDQGVQIAISQDASIDGTSAFENGMIVFRAIRPVNWEYRRPGVVVYLDGVHFGEAPSET